MDQYIGYLTLYTQILFEDGDSLFCKYGADFNKPIGDAFMEKMLNITRDFGNAQTTRTVADVRYITKDAYDRAVGGQAPDYIWSQKNGVTVTAGPEDGQNTGKPRFESRLEAADYLEELASHMHGDFQAALYYAVHALREDPGTVHGTAVEVKKGPDHV